MSNVKKAKKDLLETNLLASLHNIDSQIARAMQRSPEELERFGLSKQPIYLEKLERISQIILDSVAKNETKLDSLLVLTQALTKTLRLFIEELGSGTLGKNRSHECRLALDNMERDIRLAQQVLSSDCEQ